MSLGLITDDSGTDSQAVRSCPPPSSRSTAIAGLPTNRDVGLALDAGVVSNDVHGPAHRIEPVDAAGSAPRLIVFAHGKWRAPV